MKLGFILLLLGFFFSEGTFENSNGKDQYILKISYPNSLHGSVEAYWLLKESNAKLSDYEEVIFGEKRFRIINMISPRAPIEYFFCCESKNINLLNSEKQVTQFNSDMEKRYLKLYDKNYIGQNGGVRLKNKKGFWITRKSDNGNFHAGFFKISNDFCICLPHHSNPGYMTTDSIAQIKSKVGYMKIFKEERKLLVSALNKILLSKMIVPALPNSYVPSIEK